MRRIVILLALATVAACKSNGGEPATPGDVIDAATEGVEVGEAVDDAGPDFSGREFAVCVPGTKKGQCTDDHLGQVVCNDNGDAWTPKSCGTDSLCLDAAVGCTVCKPGSRKCQDDDTVVQCDETGSTYKSSADCNGSETGQICLNGACVKLCEVNSKINSYIGCEYWAVDLDNAFVPGGEQGFYDAKHAPYAIVVSNTSPKYSAKVQIFNNEAEVTKDRNGNDLDVSPIPPLQLRVFLVPNRIAENTIQAPLAYRVVSTIPISAYQFNPLDNVNVFSNDASLLLPSNSLGKYYFVMTREETFQELRGFLTVVGVYPDDTQVTVTVTAPTLETNGIKHFEPGESRTFILKQFDVLNIETDAYGADLTGSMVSANHPVAVFGGSQAANSPNTNHCCPDGDCTENNIWMTCKDLDNCLCEWPHHNLTPPQDVPCKTNNDCLNYNTCCADHLEKQMYPVKTWGKEYVATHTYPRGQELDEWRILAAQDGTKVTTFPSQGTAPVLGQGEYWDFEASGNVEIHAMKPVLVAQFIEAQDAPNPNIGGIKQPGDAQTGDPTFITAVPVEQFRSDYVFLTPNKYVFDAVNVIVPTGASVYLDGKELKPEDLTFKSAKDILQTLKDKGLTDPSQLGPKYGDYAVIGSGKWAVFRVVVPDGVHLAQSDQPFGVLVYGYDRYVSYGYPAGLNLEDLKLVADPTQ